MLLGPPACSPSQASQPSNPPLTEASLVMGLLLCHSRSYSCCLVCLPLPAHPSVRTQVACPFSAGQDPMQRSRVRLSHPGAQRSRPQSVLRYLTIPEVLNIISTNLGRIRVGALMTTMGSLNPNIGSQERGLDRGRKKKKGRKHEHHLRRLDGRGGAGFLAEAEDLKRGGNLVYYFT